MEISALLSDFRAKRALGLGSLYGDHQLQGLLSANLSWPCNSVITQWLLTNYWSLYLDDNMDRNKEITVVEQTLVHHLNNLL
jgi:hypothetical protein